MNTQRKGVRDQGLKIKTQPVTLTSSVPLRRGQKPSLADTRSALNCLYKAAAHMERDEYYADQIARGGLSLGLRMDLQRAVIVLLFKNASADTVWEVVEHFLVPLIRGLCEGQHENKIIMGTGMVGSDGRDHLHNLTRDEGEPLCRIIDAITRNFPQTLYGHPESDNA